MAQPHFLGGGGRYRASAPGSFGFLGLPGGGVLRMTSRADLSYKTARVMGSMPAFCSLLRTLSGFMPKTFAISSSVYPSMFIVSEYTGKDKENIREIGFFA